jgi:hypothetical protein
LDYFVNAWFGGGFVIAIYDNQGGIPVEECMYRLIGQKSVKDCITKGSVLIEISGLQMENKIELYNARA